MLTLRVGVAAAGEAHTSHLHSNISKGSLFDWGIQDIVDHPHPFERMIDWNIRQVEKIDTPHLDVYEEIIHKVAHFSLGIEASNETSVTDKRSMQCMLNKLLAQAPGLLLPQEYNQKVVLELSDGRREISDAQFRILKREWGCLKDRSNVEQEVRLCLMGMSGKIFDDLMHLMLGNDDKITKPNLILLHEWAEVLQANAIRCSCNNMISDVVEADKKSAELRSSNFLPMLEVAVKQIPGLAACRPSEWKINPSDLLGSITSFARDARNVVLKEHWYYQQMSRLFLELPIIPGVNPKDALTIPCADGEEIKVSRAQLIVLNLESPVFQELFPSSNTEPMKSKPLSWFSSVCFVGLMDVMKGDAERIVLKDPLFYVPAATFFGLYRVFIALKYYIVQSKEKVSRESMDSLIECLKSADKLEELQEFAPLLLVLDTFRDATDRQRLPQNQRYPRYEEVIELCTRYIAGQARKVNQNPMSEELFTQLQQRCKHYRIDIRKCLGSNDKKAAAFAVECNLLLGWGDSQELASL